MRHARAADAGRTREPFPRSSLERRGENGTAKHSLLQRVPRSGSLHPTAIRSGFAPGGFGLASRLPFPVSCSYCPSSNRTRLDRSCEFGPLSARRGAGPPDSTILTEGAQWAGRRGCGGPYYRQASFCVVGAWPVGRAEDRSETEGLTCGAPHASADSHNPARGRTTQPRSVARGRLRPRDAPASPPAGVKCCIVPQEAVQCDPPWQRIGERRSAARALSEWPRHKAGCWGTTLSSAPTHTVELAPMR